MTCHSPTERQKSYAESLVKRLTDDDPAVGGLGRKYGKKVKDCICIQEMSDFIDAMKDELDNN